MGKLVEFIASVCVAGMFLAVLACDGEDVEIPLTPFSELQWPKASTPPACTSWLGTYAVPKLQPVSGLLRMSPSAVLVPTQVKERIEVRVLRADGTLDDNANGQLALEAVEGMEILSVGMVQQGYGEVVVQFTEEGVFLLQLTMQGDLRLGSVELQSYQRRVPIWRLAVNEEELKDIFKNSSERIKIPGLLTVQDTQHETTLRIHGGASRDFPKKSLRFGLQGTALESGESEVILRAEYNDKSMLRTYLGYEMFRNGTVLPTPKTQFVHLRINDRYYGLMHHVERIDSRFLASNGLNPNGNLYEADPPSELSVPGGNLTLLETAEAYYRTYQWHSGAGAWSDLIYLIEFVLILPGDAFAAVIADEVRLDDYIPYLAMMAVLQNHEHIRKNFYLYRDPESIDSRWVFFPWDLDLAMGHLWSEIDDVLDQRLVVDGDLFVGEYAPQRYGYFNQLADRVLNQPVLRERFLQTVGYIVEHSFTEAFVQSRIQYANCLLEPDILADEAKWAGNDEYLQRVEELLEFVRGRRAYIASVLSAMHQ